MRSLRKAVLNNAVRGAKLYAIVEECHYGRATVRLAEDGARLSNLVVYGASVSPGETVIIDYSAEGVPSVRPLTIPEPEVGLSLDGMSISEEVNTKGMVAGKIYASSSFLLDSYYGPYMTGGSSQVQLDSIAYDIGGGAHDRDGYPGRKELHAPVAGTYLLTARATLAANPRYFVSFGVGTYDNSNSAVLHKAVDAWESYTDSLTVEGCVLTRLNKGNYCRLLVRLLTHIAEEPQGTVTEASLTWIKIVNTGSAKEASSGYYWP